MHKRRTMRARTAAAESLGPFKNQWPRVRALIAGLVWATVMNQIFTWSASHRPSLRLLETMVFGCSLTCLLLFFSRASCLLSLLLHPTSVMLLSWSHHRALLFLFPSASFLDSLPISLQPPSVLIDLSSVSWAALVSGHSAMISSLLFSLSLSCPVAASSPSPSKSSCRMSRGVRSLSGTFLLTFRETWERVLDLWHLLLHRDG